VARATGGLVWSGTAGAGELHGARMAQVYEEWARPVRIHALGLKVKGIPDGTLDVPPSLAEGEGFEDLRLGASDVAEVAISGELWATPIHKELRPDDGEARVWSALAFGAPEILGALDEKEMMVLAQRGHAVSPVTSLLAIEPGVRPSTEGLDELGTIGHGGGFGIGQGFGSAHGTCPPGGQEAFLRDAIRRGLDACGGSGRAATVELEATRDEIVDVPRVVVHGAVDATIERCLSDAAWEIDLPRWFTSPWQSWTITV
jgi:hypothetical protein